jgi:ankyrin repeat protein
MSPQLRLAALGILAWLVAAGPCAAQRAPGEGEIAAYTGLHAAVVGGGTAEIERLVQEGADLEARDAFGRTPLMVAVYRRDLAIARTLIEAGANPNALEHQSYDALTIAAVLDDAKMVKLLIAAGANTRAITSPYGGTALIAAAHLGHAEVVKALIAGRAPLDHVNRLGTTALIEAIVLGDGGARQEAVVAALLAAGADPNLPDRQGAAPLSLARGRGYAAIARLLEQAGAKP